MESRLIGMRVMNKLNKKKGHIVKIKEGVIVVSDGLDYVNYPFPEAFSDTLALENKQLQEEFKNISDEAAFRSFIKKYTNAINNEIGYLKETGGKRYRIIDGVKLPGDRRHNIYSFDTDSELHFPDNTAIKLWLPEKIVTAYTISCDDFTIVFQTMEDLGERVETLEFTAEPWQLMETLVDRLRDLDSLISKLAFNLTCQGKSMINKQGMIVTGQNAAFRKATSSPITFIWGPPGTGKTTTLAKTAIDFINKGMRVLMLSYSNVSVDGALLRVASMYEGKEGQVIRYGYPRMPELLENEHLTSYGYVLKKRPDLAERYHELQEEKKKYRRNKAKNIEINKEINLIRSRLLAQEKELIQNSLFVATTVSKAVVDSAIYTQMFDLVLFDEASMAYVPQVVYAAGLARKSFCCFGDFRQLPAIVQNPYDTILRRDIFDYVGITEAVEMHYGHGWLVMLNDQYRMHPEIAEFVSKNMYQNMLRTPDSLYRSRQTVANISPMSGMPISLIDLSNTYSVCIKTRDGSRINMMSALFCVFLAEKISIDYEVGIITPYSAQARLVLALIRDLRDKNDRYTSVSSATVHQFQGSEKSVIIYDAVDCFRMPYPGVLLTQKKNDTANRLFNVAITRAQGKFLMVTNRDYMFRKNISKDLLFTKLLRQINEEHLYLWGDDIFQEIATEEGEEPEVFLGNRDEVDSWDRFIIDLNKAKSDIFIEMPGPMDKDDEALSDLIRAFNNAQRHGVKIYIRVAEGVRVAKQFDRFIHVKPFVTTPFTIIDKKIIWFGEPLSSANFLSEDRILETEYFPCFRFEGKITARMLKAIYEIP